MDIASDCSGAGVDGGVSCGWSLAVFRDDLFSSDSGAVDSRGSEAAETSAPNDSITSHPVQIQALDQGVIILRGKKSDVDRIVRTLDEVKQENQSAQNPPNTQGVVKWFDPFADGDEVVVSIGGDDGIKPGDLLTVRRKGKTVGQLQVVSARRDEANARIVRVTSPLENGDEIQLIESESDDSARLGGEPTDPENSDGDLTAPEASTVKEGDDPE